MSQQTLSMAAMKSTYINECLSSQCHAMSYPTRRKSNAMPASANSVSADLLAAYRAEAGKPLSAAQGEQLFRARSIQAGHPYHRA